MARAKIKQEVESHFEFRKNEAEVLAKKLASEMDRAEMEAKKRDNAIYERLGIPRGPLSHLLQSQNVLASGMSDIYGRAKPLVKVPLRSY